MGAAAPQDLVSEFGAPRRSNVVVYLTLNLAVLVLPVLLYYVFVVQSHQEQIAERNFRALNEAAQQINSRLGILANLYRILPEDVTEPAAAEPAACADCAACADGDAPPVRCRPSLAGPGARLVTVDLAGLRRTLASAALQDIEVLCVDNQDASGSDCVFEQQRNPAAPRACTATMARDTHMVVDHASYPATIRAVPCAPRDRSAFQGIRLAVPASALLTRGEALARFDTVLLTTDDGRVLAEWGATSATAERPGIHREIHISSDRIDMAGLYEQVQFERLNDAPDPRLAKFPLDATQRAALRDLQRGDAWIRELDHGEDAITVTKLPFHPAFPVIDSGAASDATGDDPGDTAVAITALNVVGITHDEILLEAMRDVSPLWILFLSGLVLLSLLAWPLARLLLLGPHNSVPFWYVRLALMAGLVIVALVTTAGLVARHYLGSLQAHRIALETYSGQVEDALDHRLDTLAGLLVEYPFLTRFAARVVNAPARADNDAVATPAAPCRAAQPAADADAPAPAAAGAAAQCRPLAAFTRAEVHACTADPQVARQLDALGLQDVFYTDAGGCIRGIDLHMDHDRDLGKRISVAPRGYFRAIAQGRPLFCAAGATGRTCSGPAGRTRGLPFAVERIFNWTSGERQVFLSVARPAALTGPHAAAAGGFGGIVAGGVSLADFWVATARDGYRFVVFEESSNTVLFHSDDSRALIENVVLEADRDDALRAALATRTPRSFVGRYHGADTLFRYTPLAQPGGTTRWGLLTMAPLELSQATVLFTAALAITLWLLQLGGALLICAVLSVAWRQLPLAVKPREALDALRGTREYHYEGRIAALGGILLAIVAIEFSDLLAPWPASVLVVALLAGALLVLRLDGALFASVSPRLRPGVKRQLPTILFTLLATIVGIASVVPAYERAMHVLESERAALYALASADLAARYRERLVTECARRGLAADAQAA
ncbi:MAG: hypothetical protein RLW62_16295, partial [Gammaproteobacteria bacterium]